MDDQVESVLLAEMIAKQPLERQKVLIQRLSMRVTLRHNGGAIERKATKWP